MPPKAQPCTRSVSEPFIAIVEIIGAAGVGIENPAAPFLIFARSHVDQHLLAVQRSTWRRRNSRRDWCRIARCEPCLPSLPSARRRPASWDHAGAEPGPGSAASRPRRPARGSGGGLWRGNLLFRIGGNGAGAGGAVAAKRRYPRAHCWRSSSAGSGDVAVAGGGGAGGAARRCRGRAAVSAGAWHGLGVLWGSWRPAGAPCPRTVLVAWWRASFSAGIVVDAGNGNGAPVRIDADGAAAIFEFVLRLRRAACQQECGNGQQPLHHDLLTQRNPRREPRLRQITQRDLHHFQNIGRGLAPRFDGPSLIEFVRAGQGQNSPQAVAASIVKNEACGGGPLPNAFAIMLRGTSCRPALDDRQAAHRVAPR